MALDSFFAPVNYGMASKASTNRNYAADAADLFNRLSGKSATSSAPTATDAQLVEALKNIKQPDLASATDVARYNQERSSALAALQGSPTLSAADKLKYSSDFNFPASAQTEYSGSNKQDVTTVNDTGTKKTDNTGLQSLTGDSNTSTTKGTPEDQAALRSLISAIPGYINKYSKESAITDSAGGVSSIIKGILNAGLPDIRTNETSAGGYDSTATKLLKDNLVSSAAVKGAEFQQQTIKDYAGITSDAAKVLTTSLSQLLDANSATTGKDKSTSTTNSSSTETTDLQKLIQDTSRSLSANTPGAKVANSVDDLIQQLTAYKALG